MVRTGTRFPEEVDGDEEHPTAVAVAIVVMVTETTWSQNIHLKEKRKDGPFSKLTITKTGHRPSQFKKISDALPVLCADKNYRGLDEVLCTGRDPVETDFMPAYSNATQWSTTHHVQIASVNPTAPADAQTNERPVTYQVLEQTVVTNVNLQKELLSEYELNSKNKSQEYNKFLADKKSLITILYGQCDEATQTEIALGDTWWL